VTELIINFDKFDTNDLVDEIEAIAYDHAKYQNCSLEDSLSTLDRVES